MNKDKLYYAKPDQSYKEHVLLTYKVWKQIIKSVKNLIDRLASKMNFDVNEFYKLSLITVVMHDIGKLIPQFQDNMQAVREHEVIDYSSNYRHELCSLPYLFYYKNQMINDKSLTFPYELFAVAGHHKRLDISQTAFEREKFAKEQPLIDDDALMHAISVMAKILDYEGIVLDTDHKPPSKYNGHGLKLLNKMMASLSQLVSNIEGESIRTKYVLIKGLLHYSDWCASSGVSLDYGPLQKPIDVINVLIKRCKLKQIPYQGLRNFQKDVSIILGNCIAIAPTGSGKTEASLMWALENIKDMGNAKLIYLLPTKATANSIWKRLIDIFGHMNVGLSHSSAHNYFYYEDDSYEYSMDYEKERNLLFDRTFIRPATVATVDQILSIGYHTKHWTVKEFNSMNSVIIIDEVHAYDGWTMGLLIKTIERLSSLGARFLLMSATMPKYLVDLFSKTLKNVKVVQDDELLSEARSNYQIDERNISDAYDDIINTVMSGYKVLVVVNTVDTCQKMAEELGMLNPICYHSRFIEKDRKAIERNIENANLVIATQIVEVSLDIDFDWLYTECAPPDALAQRAGRVNRYRDPNRNSQVIIFKPGEKSQRLYNPLEDPELLSRTYEAFRDASCSRIKESDLLEILESVYAGFPMEETDAYKQAISMYKKSQQDRLYILDSLEQENEAEVTRLEKYTTISTIPLCFYNEILDLMPGERTLYEVKIPYWYYRKHFVVCNGIVLCNILYDTNYGAILEPDTKCECI